jgi:outer membrane protein assembly factor BamD
MNIKSIEKNDDARNLKWVLNYMKLEYTKAVREQIAPAYRGKPQAEKLFYMFSVVL